MHSLLHRRSWIKVTVVLLLSILFLLQWSSAVNTSQTIDEAVHLASGYTYLTRGDFRLNPEHPPLLKELAAFPLLFLSVRAPFDHPSWEAEDQWEFGRQFLYQNTVPFSLLLLLGRLPTMLLSLGLGLLVFRWAKDLFGVLGGLVALFIVVFDPTIIAHGQLITTDLGFSLLFLLSIYGAVRYLQKPTISRLALLTVLFALAQSAKFSALVLWPILPMIVLMGRWHPEGATFRFLPLPKKLGHILLFVVGTFTLVSVTYGFEKKVPVSLPEVQTFFAEHQNDWFANPTSAIGSFITRTATTTRLPLITYAQGIGKVSLHNASGHSAFLAGKSNEPEHRGWWWYFPYALLVKSPSGLLLLLPIIMTLLIRHYGTAPASPWVMLKKMPLSLLALLSGTAVYGLTSLNSNINLGVRHVLLFFPTIAILAGSIALLARSPHRLRFARALAVTLLAWIPFRTVLEHPHHLSYFNEFVGGWRNGHRHLRDSNLDWGQDLIRLRAYLDRRPAIDGNLAVAYFGSADVSAYVPVTQSVPKNLSPSVQPEPGTYVVSVSLLLSSTEDLAWLSRFSPMEIVGRTLYVYEFDRS